VSPPRWGRMLWGFPEAGKDVEAEAIDLSGCAARMASTSRMRTARSGVSDCGRAGHRGLLTRLQPDRRQTHECEQMRIGGEVIGDFRKLGRQGVDPAIKLSVKRNRRLAGRRRSAGALATRKRWYLSGHKFFSVWVMSVVE